MADKSRILVIGSADLASVAAKALPQYDIVNTDAPLAGVWNMGREKFDEALVSLSLGDRAVRTLRSLREIAPQARIVVSCDPIDEPVAREALADGADDYVLEPLSTDDVRYAFRPRTVTAEAPPAPAGDATPTIGEAPSMEELTDFSEILRNLADGPETTLERLARLVQRAFQARGVIIELDDYEVRVGDVGAMTLDEPIARRGREVGRVRVGPRMKGEHTAAASRRLADMTRLIEASVKEARERERLRDLAWTDDLSQLRNRRYFDQAIDDLLSAARDKQSRVTVLLFDIDDFKHYNDNYGHATGDELIREISLLLRRCSRKNDIVARYGGDEFAVIFWDAEQPRVVGSRHPQEPIELAERFQMAISDHHFDCLGHDAPGPVTISGGLACYPWHGKTRDELTKAADDALLAAKRTGKNRIVLAGEQFEPVDE